MLSWIKVNDKEFTAFVENRFKEIQSDSNVNNWHYIETE